MTTQYFITKVETCPNCAGTSSRLKYCNRCKDKGVLRTDVDLAEILPALLAEYSVYAGKIKPDAMDAGEFAVLALDC